MEEMLNNGNLEKRMTARRSAAALLCALAMLACGSDEGVVARVDGRAITQAEFEAYLAYRNVPATDAARRDAALDKYLEREALAAVIERQGVLDEQRVAVELNEYRKEMLISRYFDAFLSERVTDQAVLNYYNANPQQFEEERVHAAHILLRTRRDMDDSERKVQLTTTQEVYSRLTAGADFAEVAESYSEDKVSGKKGGDLGWLKRGAISEVFSEKVFSMDEGDLSEPFETPFGFHVVLILEKPRTIKKAFESVKGDIRYQLRNQAKDAELERLLEGMQLETLGVTTG